MEGFESNLLHANASAPQMEQNAEKIIESEPRPSVLMLNDYCFMDIFDYLPLEDAINLSECCHRLHDIAYWRYRKFKEFKIDAMMIIKGDVYTKRILSNIGRRILSLQIDCRYNDNIDLANISFHCMNVQQMKLSFWKENEADNRCYNFNNVKQLTMWNCDFNSNLVTSFLKSFTTLKFLKIRQCKGINFNTIFRNNPNIESFICSDNTFNDLELLQTLPNLDKLSLWIAGRQSELNLLLPLNGLTKLSLLVYCSNVNHFLTQLAKKDRLRELELHYVRADEHFLKILKSFKQLELMTISINNLYQLKSTIVWPPNLKALRLQCYPFTYQNFEENFIPTIRQLKSLERFDLSGCVDEIGSYYIINVTELGDQIVRIISKQNKQKRLDVVLRKPDALSDKKILYNSEHLRIIGDNGNVLQINIDFHS